MAGIKQVILSAAASAALACAPVAPARAVVPLVAFLGHLLIAHHVVRAAAHVTRAPFIAAPTAAYRAPFFAASTAAYRAPFFAASTAAYVAQQSMAAYAPPAPYNYGYSGYYSSPPPAYYASAPQYYAPVPYYAYRGPAYYPSGRAYGPPSYYASGPGYRPSAYPPRQVYYGAARGYYRSQVSYSQSVPRAYGPARSYDAPRANYRGSYAFQSAGRVTGFGYRR
jgi:hypothetical protein